MSYQVPHIHFSAERRPSILAENKDGRFGALQLTMSQKITSKNLSYSSSLPPFLQALHARAGGDEPAATGQRRAAKKRSGSEEAEDVPLVVDEEGNVVNVEVDKEGVVKSADALENDDAEDKPAKKDGESGKTAIGGRKRKVGRVVGESVDEGAKAGKGEDDKGKSGRKDKEESKEKRPKKKPKKIKLSFDDEEG